MRLQLFSEMLFTGIEPVMIVPVRGWMKVAAAGPRIDFASNQVWDQFQHAGSTAAGLAEIDEAAQWPPAVLPSVPLTHFERPEP